MTATGTHARQARPPAPAEHLKATQSRVPLSAAVLGGITVSVALGFALRALGRALSDVPAGLSSLRPAALLPATILPVVGNCLGFYMSSRGKPTRYSTRIFLGAGALIGLGGVAISARKLPASANGGSVITTIAVALAPTLLITPALLTLVARCNAR